MSSITTAVPTGLVTTDWCIQAQRDYDQSPNECADPSRNQQPSDFETFCCDGAIIDMTQNLYSWASSSNRTFDLANLVCCQVPGSGPQQGGLMPIQTDRSQCTQGSPTSLLSLAATNTANAVYYPVTYTSASASVGSTTTAYGDYVPVQEPTCLWVYTKTGLSMANITVAAATISTPPPTTDPFGVTHGALAPSTSGSISFSALASSTSTPYPQANTAASSASSITATAASSTSASSAASGLFAPMTLPWLCIGMLLLHRFTREGDQGTCLFQDTPRPV